MPIPPPPPPPIPKPTAELPREPSLSDTHVYTSRPSVSLVLRAGAPQRSTTSSYVAPSQLPVASASSAPGGAQPASRTTTSVALLIRPAFKRQRPEDFSPAHR